MGKEILSVSNAPDKLDFIVHVECFLFAVILLLAFDKDSVISLVFYNTQLVC